MEPVSGPSEPPRTPTPLPQSVVIPSQHKAKKATESPVLGDTDIAPSKAKAHACHTNRSKYTGRHTPVNSTPLSCPLRKTDRCQL